jgi:hypothetical protein
MNVQETFRTLLGIPPRKSVLIQGQHGIGKSQVVAQAAAEMSRRLKKPFGFIDIRLGQYEVGDLIGIPRPRDEFTIVSHVFKDGSLTKTEYLAKNVTVHDLPLWFPRDVESCGYMFFDELNRGSRDTQQWAFQVVLDYKANFHEVPIGWRVIAACNDNQDVYNVLNLDPALLDRFLVIDFRPTVPEWLAHAKSLNVHDAVVTYIKKMEKDLYPPTQMEAGIRYPSPRSWVSLSDVIKHMVEAGDDILKDYNYLYLLSSGYLGKTVALSFQEYVKKDYKVYTAKDILDNFPKLKEEFEKFAPTDLTFYNGLLTDYCKGLKKLTPKQGENLFSYFQTIPKEVAAGFWTEFLKECKVLAADWLKADKERADYMMSDGRFNGNGIWNKSTNADKKGSK